MSSFRFEVGDIVRRSTRWDNSRTTVKERKMEGVVVKQVQLDSNNRFNSYYVNFPSLKRCFKIEEHLALVRRGDNE